MLFGFNILLSCSPECVMTVTKSAVLNLSQAQPLSGKSCASLPEGYVTSRMNLVETLRSLGYILRAVQENEIFDRSLIDAVHPGPHHYNDGIAE